MRNQLEVLGKMFFGAFLTSMFFIIGFRVLVIDPKLIGFAHYLGFMCILVMGIMSLATTIAWAVYGAMHRDEFIKEKMVEEKLRNAR